jgi:hypothetical protein
MSFHLRAEYQHPPADGEDYSTRLHDMTPLAPHEQDRHGGEELRPGARGQATSTGRPASSTSSAIDSTTRVGR